MDCIKYIKTIPDLSINTAILDPPYFNVVNEKWDNQWSNIQEYTSWMENIIRELNRVCKYSACVWLFGYPYQLSHLIPIFEKHGFTYRQHIVVNKGLKSLAGRANKNLKMFPTVTEYVILFFKESRYLIRDYLLDKKLQSGLSSSEINRHLGKSTTGGGTWSLIAGKRNNLSFPTIDDWNKLDKLFGGLDIQYDDYVYKFYLPSNLTDVWDDINFYDRTYPKVHPTQKPYQLIDRLIKCTTDENDVVLDLFSGSGMTAVVCQDIKRIFYGCEINEEYVKNSLLK